MRAGACALIAMAAALAACSRGTSEEGAAGPVAQVTVTKVARAAIVRTITVSGTIAALPNHDVRVGSLVAGRVAALPVAEGDRVTAGERIARIDDRPIRDQLQQAEAEGERARASLQNARSSRERNETLFDRGIAARKDLEDARMQESVAEASLRQAEAAVALARLQLDRTEIRSPLSGVVVRRFASVGEQVDGTEARPLVEVADLREVELLAGVPAAYLDRVRAGQTIEMSSDAIPGRALRASVVAVSPAVDPATGIGLARVRLGNADGVLRLGMFLTARLPIETHEGALVVPPQSVYRDEEDRPRVYRVEGDAATAVPVVLGIETADRDEILSGVGEGDIVIRIGGYGLGASAKVKVVP